MTLSTNQNLNNMQQMQDDDFTVEQRLMALKNCLEYLQLEASSEELNVECVASALEVAVLSLQKRIAKHLN